MKELKLTDIDYRGSNDLIGLLMIPPDSKVKFIGTQSVYGGFHKDFLYRIVGTDDLIRIQRPDDPEKEDTALLQKGYFAERREFANRVGELSRKHIIPFRIALALGDDESTYLEFKKALEDVDPVCIGQLRGLRAGIVRRKEVMRQILGDSLYEKLKIPGMGQDHSERIAHFIWDRCMARINS